MTDSLERVRERLDSVSELAEIVGAMRAMAAMRLQEAQGALVGTRKYADTVADALDEVLTIAATYPRAPPSRPALVLFLPEHGFVGGLTERLVSHARDHFAAAVIVAVGDRGADVAEEQGVALHARLSLGAHINAGPAVARRLESVLEPLLERGRVDAVEVLYAHYQGGGRSELQSRRLLPVAPRRGLAGASRPLVNLPPAALVDAVAGEWVLGELVHALVETLASENGARLVAMEAAHSNVNRKREDLQGAWRVARQEAITSEIAEVVAGVLAQEGPGMPQRGPGTGE